jgi:hypothetical protein
VPDRNVTPNFKIPREVFDTGVADARTFNEAMDLIDTLLGGGTGGKITVASAPAGDPAEIVVTDVTKIRFVTEFTPGSHHVVFDNGGGEVLIGATPPPPTLQGQDLEVYPTKFRGGLSVAALTSYKPADPAGAIVDYITRGNNWNVSTPAACFGYASVGFLILSLNGVDVATIDLGANFVELDRLLGQNMANYNIQGAGDIIAAGVVSFPGGELRITAVAPSGAGADPYQKGSATVVVNGCLRRGWNTLQLRHFVAPLTYTANPWECFEDYNPPGPAFDPVITALDMDLNILSTKWLSGVQYCGIGTTFFQDLVAQRCVDNVYHETSLPVTLDAFTGLSLNRPTFAAMGVIYPPTIGDICQFTDRVVTLDVPSAYSEDARLRAVPRDPYGSYTAFWSASEKILVNTYGNVSTSLWEPCQDENWRLPSGAYNVPPAPWTGNYSSPGDLGVYDGNLGLQYRSGGVYYPAYDYTTYIPTAGQPNYAPLWAADTARFTYRGFRDNGISHSNGVIRLPGITDAMLAASTILVWIKVPTRTGWLRLHGTLYNPVGWTGIDNDPCRVVGGSGNDHNFTLATLGTNPAADWGIVVRIEFPNRTCPSISGAWGMVGW